MDKLQSYNNVFYNPTNYEVSKYDATLRIIQVLWRYNNSIYEKRNQNIRNIKKIHENTNDNTNDNQSILMDNYIFTNPFPILLHINSNKSINIVDAFPLMDSIMLLNRIQVSTVIDSVCKDSLILPFLVGKKRYISEYAHIYITPSFYDSSGMSSIKDKMNNLITIKKKILKIFKKYTKFSKEIYKNLFKREIFLTTGDCIKYGIADKII